VLRRGHEPGARLLTAGRALVALLCACGGDGEGASLPSPEGRLPPGLGETAIAPNGLGAGGDTGGLAPSLSGGGCADACANVIRLCGDKLDASSADTPACTADCKVDVREGGSSPALVACIARAQSCEEVLICAEELAREPKVHEVHGEEGEEF
jgi:hypothetical protein